MKRQRKKIIITLLIAPVVFFSHSTFSQAIISLDSAFATALRSHPSILQSQTQIVQQQQLVKSSFSLANPEFGIEIPAHDFSWTVSQSIEFPLVYTNQSKLGRANIALAQQSLAITQNELHSEVMSAFLQLQFSEAQMAELKKQDSLFFAVSNANDRRYGAGEIGLLEKLNANNAYQNKHNLLVQSQTDFLTAQKQLLILTGSTASNPRPDQPLIKFVVPQVVLTDSVAPFTNLFSGYAIKNSMVALRNWKLEKSKALPGFFGTYFNNGGKPADVVTPSRFDLGISFPLWFWQYSARNKAAKYQWQAANYQMQATTLAVNVEWQQALSDFKKFSSSLNYYETSALPQADKIIDASTRSYRAGEIGYIELLQNLSVAFQTKLDYLDAIRDFNQAIIQLHKLSGQ